MNSGSIAGITGNFSTAYSSSKWALEGHSRSGAYVYAGWGIRCNVIQPGLVETDMTARINSNPLVRKMTEHTMSHTVLLRPNGQGGGDRHHGAVPGQRRVVLHHRDRHCGRRRVVLLRSLPRQRALTPDADHE